MTDEKATSKKSIILFIGLFCIAGGLIFNEWTAARFLSEDGNIAFTNKLIIRIAQVIAVVLGLTLIFLRKNIQTLINLSFSIFTLLLCLIVVEVAVRLVGYDGSKSRSEIPLFIENPRGTGSYQLEPNLDITRKVGQTKLVIQTNSKGMRWREVSVTKPGNKQRIAFVGDSFTFGMWADSVEKSFVGIFESKIDTSKYQVLNFGVPGYSLTDIKLQLEEVILEFDPQLIFLMFYNGNDMRGTYLGNDKFDIKSGLIIWNDSVRREKLPVDWTNEDDEQEQDRNGGLIPDIDDLYLYKIFSNKLKAIKASPTSIDTVFKVNNNFMKGYEFWSMAEYPEIGIKAKEKTLEILEDIRKLCDANGISLLIGTVPYVEQVYAAKETGENYDINYPQKYIEDYSQQKNLPYIDLLPTLREYYKKNKTPLHFLNDSHYGNTGNYLMGDTLAWFFNKRIEE